MKDAIASCVRGHCVAAMETDSYTIFFDSETWDLGLELEYIINCLAMLFVLQDGNGIEIRTICGTHYAWSKWRQTTTSTIGFKQLGPMLVEQAQAGSRKTERPKQAGLNTSTEMLKQAGLKTPMETSMQAVVKISAETGQARMIMMVMQNNRMGE